MRPMRHKWFFVWLAIGATFGLAILGTMSIGIFVLPVAAIATVVALRRPGAEAGLPGLISGASLPVFYVAFLNRDGPGTVCTAISGGQSCTDEYNPWPWLAVAVALVVTGAAIYHNQQHR